MPIYRFKCDMCVLEIEKIQGMNEETPQCPNCGEGMRKLLTFPAMVKVKGEGGTPVYSKGYKEGYSKEYLESLGKMSAR